MLYGGPGGTLMARYAKKTRWILALEGSPLFIQYCDFAIRFDQESRRASPQ